MPTKTQPESESTMLMEINHSQLSVSKGAVTLIDRMHAIDEHGARTMSDDDVVDIFMSTVMAEAAAFVIRGAAAYELVERAAASGQRFTTTRGGGIDSVLVDIVKRTGVKRATIYEDYKIYDRHRSDMLTSLADNPDNLLPRELYRLANQVESTTWATPQDMVDYFREMRDSGFAYTSDHARRDVKRVNSGMTIDEVREADIQEREQVIEEIAASESVRVAVAKIPTLTVRLTVKDNTQRYVDRIIEHYGSFDAWFDRKTSEEFGEIL